MKSGSEDVPHLLYVSWNYPPARSPGVYRARATANAFAQHGWRVTVLTATKDSFERTGVDVSLEDSIDQRIDVVRIPFRWPPEVDEGGHKAPNLRKLGSRIRSAVDWRLRQVPFPEVRYGSWSIPLKRAAQRIHERLSVDLVVASAGPNVDFSAASYLHRRFGIPYVLDYRDAWILSLSNGTQLYPDASRQAKCERKLIAQATEVWFVNEPIREWHQRRYVEQSDRMYIVANGYDEEYAPYSFSDRPAKSAGGLVFGYIGSLYNDPPLAEFAAGWRRARTRWPVEFEAARTEFWGHVGLVRSAEAKGAPDLFGLDKSDGFVHMGPLPKVQVAKKYGDFDVLLLILPNGPFITGGKVYEYMASGLPIVSIHDPKNHSSTELAGYPLWFPTEDLSPDGVAEALREAARAARSVSSDLRRSCLAYAMRFRRDHILEPRLSALKHIVQRR